MAPKRYKNQLFTPKWPLSNAAIKGLAAGCFSPEHLGRLLLIISGAVWIINAMKNNTGEPPYPFLDDRSWPLEEEFDKKGFKAICVADPSANRLLSEFKEGETYWAYPLGGKKGYLIWPDALTNTVCTPDDFKTYFLKKRE